MKKINLIACLSVLALSACVTEEFTSADVNQPLMENHENKLKNSSYLKLKSKSSVIQSRKINFIGRIPLVEALRRFLSEYHVAPMDSGVQLDQVVEINAIDMPADQFVQYLAASAALDIQVQQQSLEIRSFLTKEWMLGALSGGKKMKLSSNAALNKGLDEETPASSVQEDISYDEWESLIEAAREILGVSQAQESGLNAYVYGSRSVGKIVAGGPVQAMRRLDDYLTGLEKASTRQVAIEVKAFDVMLTDDRGSGVNWQEFAALGASMNGNPVNFGIANAGGAGVATALANEGIWRGQAGYQSSAFSANAVLQFLSRYGDVELLNQPNLTVRNGGFAIMHAGDQLSYVAETEVVRESDSDTVAVSAKVEQLKVGVSLAVSPKLLDDKRILLNIWPVVSSVQGFDEFSADPVPVRVPRLALQELSTEVIVESGKTIQLGGLIRKSMVESLQTLPFRDGITGVLLKPFFHAESKNLERRELVILVTPRLVEAGQ